MGEKKSCEADNPSLHLAASGADMRGDNVKCQECKLKNVKKGFRMAPAVVISVARNVVWDESFAFAEDGEVAVQFRIFGISGVVVWEVAEVFVRRGDE